MTATTLDIDVTNFTDDALLRWQAWCVRRLNSRGGGWLAEDMANTAEDLLKRIEAEIGQRPTMEGKQP